MSFSPDNNDNHRPLEEDFSDNNQQSAPPRRSRGRRRGGVGVGMPNAHEMQMINPSESLPGGPVFRYDFYVYFHDKDFLDFSKIYF
jgi:hypothetical protein